MTIPLVPGLSFGPAHSSLPPVGQLLLITDHLASPSDFILHRALALYLKCPTPNLRCHVILVSLACEFAHWQAIAAKSNVNLGLHLKAGSLAYIDGLSLSAYRSVRPTGTQNADQSGYFTSPSLFGSGDGELSLKNLYDGILQSLQTSCDTTEAISQQVVIVDDITLLELIGVPNIVIIRFIRALRATCRRHSAALIIRAHASPPTNTETGIPFDSDLLRALIDACLAHVEVLPLASGRSGSVSGEIAVHMGGLTVNENNGGAEMGRRTGVQYRLSDSGAVFFQKGMGMGVL